MNPIKITGIVIRQINVGDYNKMLTVLSSQLGKISVWAKGIRSAKNASSPACGLLCYSEFVVYPRGEAYSLSDATVIESFYHLRENVENLATGMYFADLAGHVCEEAVPSADILKLLLNSLYYLEKNLKPKKELRLMYELRLLALAGFMPETGNCSVCGSGEIEFFDSEIGGALCVKHKTLSSKKITYETLCVIKFYLFSGLKEALETNADEKDIKNALVISEDFIKSHIGKNLKTLEYLKNVSE